MRRHVFAATGWVVAGLALLGGGAVVRSQTSFPDGAFVRAQDGTEWVVSGTMRYQITWMTDDANVVPQLQRGPSVSTAGQLAAALAAAPPASAATATPPPPPPAPVAATPPPPPPTAATCNLQSETTTTTSDNGTVTITTNFNGVQGLVQQVVTLSGAEGGSVTSYSIPAWLQAAYNGNIEAIYRDIASGVLANRCAS
jgi:hypothetical protein